MPSLFSPQRQPELAQSASHITMQRGSVGLVAVVLLLAMLSFFAHLVSEQVVRGAGVRQAWRTAELEKAALVPRKRDHLNTSSAAR